MDALAYATNCGIVSVTSEHNCIVSVEKEIPDLRHLALSEISFSLYFN